MPQAFVMSEASWDYSCLWYLKHDGTITARPYYFRNSSSIFGFHDVDPLHVSTGGPERHVVFDVTTMRQVAIYKMNVSVS
jgi:hypothetical protein